VIYRYYPNPSWTGKSKIKENPLKDYSFTSKHEQSYYQSEESTRAFPLNMQTKKEEMFENLSNQTRSLLKDISIFHKKKKQSKLDSFFRECGSEVNEAKNVHDESFLTKGTNEYLEFLIEKKKSRTNTPKKIHFPSFISPYKTS